MNKEIIDILIKGSGLSESDRPELEKAVKIAREETMNPIICNLAGQIYCMLEANHYSNPRHVQDSIRIAREIVESVYE